MKKYSIYRAKIAYDGGHAGYGYTCDYSTDSFYAAQIHYERLIESKQYVAVKIEDNTNNPFFDGSLFDWVKKPTGRPRFYQPEYDI